jgi:hypothetical protein
MEGKKSTIDVVKKLLELEEKKYAIQMKENHI